MTLQEAKEKIRELYDNELQEAKEKIRELDDNELQCLQFVQDTMAVHMALAYEIVLDILEEVK